MEGYSVEKFLLLGELGRQGCVKAFTAGYNNEKGKIKNMLTDMILAVFKQ